ncbi:unnamed protein product [Alopecurus aequalis]
MADLVWSGVDGAATVAQLVGVDASGLISKIKQTVVTAQQNQDDCGVLACQADIIAELLRQVKDPAARRPLAELGAALKDAHELVLSCQGRGRTHRFFNASRQAFKFRKVQRRIDSLLAVVPVICLAVLARRLDGTGNVTVLNRPSSSQPAVSQEEPVGGERFTLAEILEATDNFALELGRGDSGKVYKGVLHDRREVAVKRLKDGLRCAEVTFDTELAILRPVRHQHVVRLLGSCAEGAERLLVYEHMDNGTLRGHLDASADADPAVAASWNWKTRVDVLLGAAVAVKHLHCRAEPPLMHSNVTSSNILLDRSWTPRLSGFGASVWRDPDEESQDVDVVHTTDGYADPEYCRTRRLKQACDVYSLGVVILEVLTGKQPDTTLVSWALPSIQAGNLGDVLDRRPASKPTPRQQKALQVLASTAKSCLLPEGDNRPGIAGVVADLEKALTLMCTDKLKL